MWTRRDNTTELVPHSEKHFMCDVQLEEDVGTFDILRQWCCKPNVGPIPFCPTCGKMMPLDLMDLDGMRERFTAGAPEDQVDEPHATGLDQTDDGHKPPEPDWFISAAEHSVLDTSSMMHWRDGVLNSAAWKRRCNNAIKHIS